MEPLVSVIIPTYKRGRDLLTRAIESVLTQTYPNIEIVVVDDNPPNSTERLETEATMLGYSNRNNVVYIKNKDNLGGSRARNQGASNARGKYITFLDDDDIYLPEKISTQIKYMLDNDLDMSFTDLRIHNSEDRLMDYREHISVDTLSKEDLLKYHLMHHLTGTPTFMFKAEAFMGIGGFTDVRMGQEFMLMIKIIESDLKIGYLPVAHVIQYLHEGERISKGKNKIVGERELFRFKKKYFHRLNFRERQYVKFRHYAVMMVVSLREKSFFAMLKYFTLAILSSPIDCVIQLIHYIKKICKHRSLK